MVGKFIIYIYNHWKICGIIRVNKTTNLLSESRTASSAWGPFDVGRYPRIIRSGPTCGGIINIAS